MHDLLPTLLGILGVVAAISLMAQRVSVPAPVLLVLAGMAWSLLPAVPQLALAPEVILSVFLPPLLYGDAWSTSWLDFRRWLRPILQLAIGLVATTILFVGLVAHWAIPTLPWAACFLLGAIVSPTDTVAVQAVLERLRVPRRVTAILGGEGLVNDATALLGVSLATVVVLTGMFEAAGIGLRFLRIAGLGVAIGGTVGWLAVHINRRVRGTTALFAFSLLAPYLSYFLAEQTGASGVLAVVVAGFVASWRVHDIAPESRVELYATWDVLQIILNSVMFLFVGLEAPRHLFEAVSAAPGIVRGALEVSLAVVIVRLGWMLPSAYLPLWLSSRLRRREGGYPNPHALALTGWCGVRGAVSLAAALSVPSVLPNGDAFPGRTEIVTCTLVVIVVTLIGQGTTLLPLARSLGLSDADPTDVEVHGAREAMLAAGIARLDGFCSEVSCPISVYRLRDAMVDQLSALRAEDDLTRSQAIARLEVEGEVKRAVYQAQMGALLALRDRGQLNDQVQQELLLELDRANVELHTLGVED
jgi:CPA1 family monovalent cation:H+ antiporter